MVKVMGTKKTEDILLAMRAIKKIYEERERQKLLPEVPTEKDIELLRELITFCSVKYDKTLERVATYLENLKTG